jgi:hypothetical protein
VERRCQSGWGRDFGASNDLDASGDFVLTRGSPYARVVQEELAEPEPLQIPKSTAPASYAVVETLVERPRILLLTDEKTDAIEIASELRRRGLMVSAVRTVT